MTEEMEKENQKCLFLCVNRCQCEIHDAIKNSTNCCGNWKDNPYSQSNYIRFFEIYFIRCLWIKTTNNIVGLIHCVEFTHHFSAEPTQIYTYSTHIHTYSKTKEIDKFSLIEMRLLLSSKHFQFSFFCFMLFPKRNTTKECQILLSF